MKLTKDMFDFEKYDGTASCVREAKWLDIEVKEIQE